MGLFSKKKKEDLDITSLPDLPEENINFASNTANQVSGTTNNFVEDFETYTEDGNTTQSIIEVLSVEITEPTENTFLITDDITFNADYSDENGTTTCEWETESDLLSNDCEFTISANNSDLDVGIHNITVTATDSTPSTATDSITIEITDSESNFSVNITLPVDDDTFDVSENIHFQADPVGPVGPVDWDWNEGDTIFGTGQHNFNKPASDFTPGIHTVQVTGTDEAETVMTDTVQFEITDSGSNFFVNIISPVDDETFSVSETISFQAESVDPVGQVIWIWYEDGRSIGNSISFDKPASDFGVGTYIVEVTGTDEDETVMTDTVQFIVTVNQASSPTTCNNNGICEAGENEINCAYDCPDGCNENGVCDAGNHENQTSCAVDCGTSETSCSELTRKYECEGNLVVLSRGIRSISECKTLCETNAVTTCCYYNSFWNNCSYADTLNSTFWFTRYAGLCS